MEWSDGGGEKNSEQMTIGPLRLFCRRHSFSVPDERKEEGGSISLQ